MSEFYVDEFFLQQFRSGKGVVFVGAGLSAAAGLPTWEQLLRGVQAHAVAIDNTAFDIFLKRGDLLEAASELEEQMGRAALQEALRSELQASSAVPTRTHELLTKLPLQAVITTNFDQLIERAYGGSIAAITPRDSRQFGEYFRQNTRFLYKIHGDINRPDTIVLTREEYLRLANGGDVMLDLNHLFMNPVLFTGYSHRDFDLDLILNKFLDRYGDSGARFYALMKTTTPEDEALNKLLRRKSIQPIRCRDYSEVPEFFEWLLKRLKDAPPIVTDAPPQTAVIPLSAGKAAMPKLPRAAVSGWPMAILLPGFLGSELSAGKKRIWLNLFRLASGSISKLDLASPNTTIKATSTLAQFYGNAAKLLAQSHDTRLFPYDWRLDHWANAESLKDYIDSNVQAGQRCDLIAHAEGGLVARAMIARYPETWRGWNGRLILLGTPNHGSFANLMALIGESEMLRLLGTLDLVHDGEEVRRIFASFPSLYQSLPSPLRNAAWNALYAERSYGSIRVRPELLEQGREFHEQIAGAVDADRMVLIAGDGRPTVESLENPAALDGPRQWAMTERGDSMVPLRYARLESVPCYGAKAPHGELCSDAEVLAAIGDILRTGKTNQLPIV